MVTWSCDTYWDSFLGSCQVVAPQSWKTTMPYIPDLGPANKVTFQKNQESNLRPPPEGKRGRGVIFWDELSLWISIYFSPCGMGLRGKQFGYFSVPNQAGCSLENHSWNLKASLGSEDCYELLLHLKVHSPKKMHKIFWMLNPKRE